MIMRLFITTILAILVSFATAQEKGKVDTSIVKDVDRIPEFNGGSRTWQQFLTNNIKLMDAIEMMDSTQYADFGAKQTAIMEFTVCEDGSVCDVDVINKDKLSPAFVEETLRVMKKSPKWKPALKNDKPVRTRFRQHITAVLIDDL